jgi:hypothetical protein
MRRHDGRCEVADVSDGTAAGLLEFLNWAGSRGEINAGTASARAVAVRRVLDIEGVRLESIDLRAVNPDEILERFETLKRTEYSTDSMDAYKSRFRSSVNTYLAWLDKSPDWKRVGRPGHASGKGAATPPPRRTVPSPKKSSSNVSGVVQKDGVIGQPSSSVAPGEPNPVQRMIPYEVPLRPGSDMRARLVLPDDLTKADADRLSRFIQSLAFGPSDRVPRENAPGQDAD